MIKTFKGKIYKKFAIEFDIKKIPREIQYLVLRKLRMLNNDSYEVRIDSVAD
jgi:hypothetical protein